ncbi:MAG: prepilin-type N-terminal cleavage/methylation domain-containing protein [Tepidisphaeraceae bacterium]|jgi:prepilin-type N-terminal cleavage/methylation domain-containing protein
MAATGDFPSRRTATPPRKRGFTLVELLVVIGIIGILIALLLPSLSKAQAQAQKVTCMSNLRQIGQSMMIYADVYNGFLFPPNKGWQSPNPPVVAGTNPPQYDVWPYYLFKIWNPPVMICPSDQNPLGSHSYLVNAHLYPRTMDNPNNLNTQSDIQYSSGLPPGRDPTNVIVAGEKVASQYDYYMDTGDFDTKVDAYRHGILYGSNYLMLDMHVDTLLPGPVKAGLDPWDPNGTPTTAPDQ